MGHSPKAKDRSMTFVLIALLTAFAMATATVLADGGLRMWSATGGFKVELDRSTVLSLPRTRSAARVTTLVSYAGTGPLQHATRRAAA